MRNVVITIAACTLIASAGNTQRNLGQFVKSFSKGFSQGSSSAEAKAAGNLISKSSKPSGSILDSGVNKAMGEGGVVGEDAAISLKKTPKVSNSSFESNVSFSNTKKKVDLKEEIKDWVKDYLKDKAKEDLQEKVEELYERIMEGIDSDDQSSSTPLAVRQPSGSLLIYAGSFSIQAQASGQRLKNSRCSSCGAFRYGPYRHGSQKKCGHSWF